MKESMYMKFTKNKGMYFVAAFIVLAVFNVIAFIIPFKREAGFWTGYGFSMAAMFLCVGVGLYALGREEMRSKFYGMPLAYMAWFYLAVQLITGLAIMAIPAIPYQAGVIAGTVLLGGFLVGLIGVNTGKKMIERVDQKIREKVFYIKSLQVNIEGLAGRAADESIKKKLKTLAEAIRYSDPMSSPQLAALENQIEAKASALAEGMADISTTSTLCDELQQLIAERNRKCKLLK
jgi:predicted transcriptional regulator